MNIAEFLLSGMSKNYSLPRLPYGYKDLEPQISEQQLTIHHQKQAYVNGANVIFAKIALARGSGADLDMKATLKDLSWQVAGHLLHSLFWTNLASAPLSEAPSGALAQAIDQEFGSPERFKKEFTQAAMLVEGSGWAALVFDAQTERLIIMQIEKHNNNVFPSFPILLVLDVFEHAYYLDYKNDRAKFIEAFWSIVNWGEANKRFEQVK